MTPDQLKTYILDAAAAAEGVLPFVGQADLDPLVAAAATLMVQLVTVYQARTNPGDAQIAALMAAARAAADVLEAQKLAGK